MRRREELINQIVDALAILSVNVSIRSKNNLTDANVHAEDFYCAFLNLALGYKLQNINAINLNMAAIDLGGEDDQGKFIAIQVTSTSDIEKTRETVKKFIANKLHDSYQCLIILNLVKLSKHREALIGEAGVYQLDTKKDMWDHSDLISKIRCKDTAILQKIVDFLKKELHLQPHEKPSKEVVTFLALIELLSDETHPAAGKGFIEDPDPQGKIYKRFANHAVFLTKLFTDLFIQYGNVLMAVKENMDIGTVKFDRMSLYLKTYSDNILTECDNSPRLALEKMVKNFANLLNQQGIDYDENAIRFFLVQQINACNVFPNEGAINA